MAEYRRRTSVVSSVDPVTGETVYRDEVTGEIVPPDMLTDDMIVEHPAGRPVVRTGHVITQEPAGVYTHQTQAYTDDPYARRRSQVYKLQGAVYLLFGILEGLLAIRFVLRVLAANPAAGFASFVYNITAPFVWPFAGLFPQPGFDSSVVEWNTLVAIVVYALIAWILAKVIWLIAGETRSGVRTSRVNTRIDQ